MEEKFVFKNIFVNSFLSFTVALSLMFLIFVASTLLTTFYFKNVAFLALTALTEIFLFVLFCLATISEVTISQEGILVKNCLGLRKILWQEVISMAIVAYNRGYDFSHQVKTSEGVISVKPQEKTDNFEKFVADQADLELEKVGPTINALPKPIDLKRWKRKGSPYQYTSLLDRLSWFFTPGTSKIS